MTAGVGDGPVPLRSVTAARPPIEPLEDPSAPVGHEATSAPIPGPPVVVEHERGSRRPIWIGLALCFGAIAALAAWSLNRPEPLSNDDIATALEEAFSSTTVPQPLGPAIYATVIPSTVIIDVDRLSADDDGIGSGVIVSADGQILTAFHVIDGADAGGITILFSDGSRSSAEIVSTEPENDIAVLQPDSLPEVLVPAVLGGGVNVGDPVWALGAPLGLGGSLSEGIVSGLDRRIPVGDDLILENLIQFDAAVNPGSSGGPLLDRGARVVGIVTALANPSGDDTFSGLGFAVPISVAGGAAGGPAQ